MRFEPFFGVVGFTLALFSLIVLWEGKFGLANNGDFDRTMHPYTSGPVVTCAGENTARNFYYPIWHFNEQNQPLQSSTHVLWKLGALINRLCVSGDVLHMFVLSLIPRVCLIGCFGLLCAWVAMYPSKRRWLLYGLVLIPAGLMCSSLEYTVYLNSFYIECGSMIFLLLFALAAALGSGRWYMLAICALPLYGLSICKSSYVDWPLLGAGYMGLAFFLRYPAHFRPWKKGLLTWSWLLPLLILMSTQFIKKNRDFCESENPINRFNSLYYGALVFSHDPDSHLDRLELGGTESAVGHSAYSSEGWRIFHASPYRFTFSQVVSVYRHEPSSALRGLIHVMGQMQDLSLDYLGRTSQVTQSHSEAILTAPSFPANAEHRMWLRPGYTCFNLWARIKYAIFPRGGILLCALVGLTMWFGYGIVCGRKPMRALSALGLIITLAVGCEMSIALLGDGCYELIKHLFLANLCFDLSLLVFLASMVLWRDPMNHPEDHAD